MPKTREVQVKILSETTLGALEDTVNDFLLGAGAFTAENPERTYLSSRLVIDGSTFAVYVEYTE